MGLVRGYCIMFLISIFCMDYTRKTQRKARSQGSKNAERYYTNLSRLANEAAGIKKRDMTHIHNLALLQLAESVISAALNEGMIAGLPYKDIAREARERVYRLASIPGLKGA